MTNHRCPCGLLLFFDLSQKEELRLRQKSGLNHAGLLDVGPLLTDETWDRIAQVLYLITFWLRFNKYKCFIYVFYKSRLSKNWFNR